MKILAEAEAVEFEAISNFEAALSEFSPRLIALLQKEGLEIPDDDEMAVACLWDGSHRPAIEWCHNHPLQGVARIFAQAHPEASSV